MGGYTYSDGFRNIRPQARVEGPQAALALEDCAKCIGQALVLFGREDRAVFAQLALDFEASVYEVERVGDCC